MTINLAYVNSYLDAMRCLNMGPNHGVNFSIQLLKKKDKLNDTLAQHFESLVDSMGKHYEAALWHIKPEQITKEKFTQIITHWFFQLYYSPTPHKENTALGVNGFLDALLPVMLNQCYLYEINTSPPIWYATQWCDLLIIYQHEYYLLQFASDD